jgi:hypothetical protein
MAGTAKYWVAEPGGQPQGPYDVETLRRLQAEGRVSPSTQLCAEGTTTWTPASSVIGLGSAAAAAAAPPAYAPMPGYGPRGGWTGASYLWPILTTIFCCLIGGIVSIVYTAQANTKGAAGDIGGAEKAKGTAKTWMIVSLVIGLVANGGYLAAMLAGGFSSVSSASGGP